VVGLASSSGWSPAVGSEALLGCWFSFSLIPRPRACWGGGWVEHNDRFMVAGIFGFPGSAHCWVLRRHRGVFSGCSWPGPSNASRDARRVWVGVVVVGWVGVWLCVECCIVDASILL
jgi:hypothetical protein